MIHISICFKPLTWPYLTRVIHSFPVLPPLLTPNTAHLSEHIHGPNKNMVIKVDTTFVMFGFRGHTWRCWEYPSSMPVLLSDRVRGNRNTWGNGPNPGLWLANIFPSLDD